jgi:hypothetical protein
VLLLNSPRKVGRNSHLVLRDILGTPHSDFGGENRVLFYLRNHPAVWAQDGSFALKALKSNYRWWCGDEFED